MKPPIVIKDLWRDLRDKRLLPVIALLVVALVAVPVLLGGDDEAAPTPGVATAPGSASEAPEAEPVVLVDVPTIRDYNERLSQFKRQNPFRQQYTDLPKSAQQALEEQEGDGGGGGGSLDDSSTDGTDVAPAGGGSSSGSSSGGSGGGGTGTEVVYLYTWEVDVKVGPVGNAKKKNGVKGGEFLPSEQSPVVLFLSGNEKQGKAVFYVSRDVTSTSGEGRCAPNKNTCEFVLLKKGQEHRFEFEPDGKTYRLKLNDVTLKRERIDPSELSDKELRERTRDAYSSLGPHAQG